jgi:regulator of cell morphogenesis and NO signaling
MQTDATVRDFVNRDFRAASVFHRYGIDFCCGGGRTLTEACRAKNVEESAVLREISRACDGEMPRAPRYAEWEADDLARYIVNEHHGYCRTVLPVIAAHTRKLAATHGPANPELVEIAEIFARVKAEMDTHMVKEEQILFPYISQLASSHRLGLRPAPAPFGDVSTPIAMMEDDHAQAGAAMARIRELARDYAVPEHGCTTWRVTLQELEAFEQDLHTHVHLENNVLFPKAQALAAPPVS